MLGRPLKTYLRNAIALSCGAVILSFQVNTPTALASEASPEEQRISLYSETAHPNATNQGYIIFEKRGETLIGAFYYPQSEYSCFTGHQAGQNLEILSLPSYQEPMSSFSLSLNDMQAVSEIGASEQQTLAACRQNVIAFLNQTQTAMEAQFFSVESQP